METLGMTAHANVATQGDRARSRARRENTLAKGFLTILGLTNIALVGLICVYLITAGLPAIEKIGLADFLLGTRWASTAKPPQFGILPFILTSLYGMFGALILSLPWGLLVAMYLSSTAGKAHRRFLMPWVDLLASIPSVVYGFLGMLVLVPAIQSLFDLPDGSGLLASIVVLTVMVLPTIIKVASTAIAQVPEDYRLNSLALGANEEETLFRVIVPAARSGIAAAMVLGVGRALGEAMAVMMVAGNAANMPGLFESVRYLTTAVASEMAYSAGLQREALFSIALVLFVFIMMTNSVLNVLVKRGMR